jgi:aminomethyltransferase
MIALQGRNSAKVLQEITTLDLNTLGYYKWLPGQVLGFDAEISRTGYTGEDGFEIYFPVSKAEETWKALIEKGKNQGIWPIGLGARDTLRLEAGMSLYGHELTENINPLEAGLQWAVKLGTEFIGRDALKKIKEEGPKRKLVGLRIEGKRVPRQGYPVLAAGETVGEVASGTYSPTLEGNIATAFVPRDLDETREDLLIQIRNTQAKARVTPLPFYKKEY